MEIDGIVPLVLTVIFFATLVRSAFGFGEALIAVPLLALVLPVEVAAPLAVLVSITVAFVIVLQDWDKVHIHSAGWLILASLFGIPLGLWLLKAVAEPIVKAILALVLLTFSSYALAGRGRLELKNDRLAWLFGFGAGILGGAYGMNGPPLVIYGTLRRWSPQHFRATLQGYFLFGSMVVMAGYWLAGLWVAAVTRFYLLSLPLALAAVLLGRAVNRRLVDRRFFVYIHLGLIVVALVLLLQALGWWRPGGAGNSRRIESARRLVADLPVPARAFAALQGPDCPAAPPAAVMIHQVAGTFPALPAPPTQGGFDEHATRAGPGSPGPAVLALGAGPGRRVRPRGSRETVLPPLLSALLVPALLVRSRGCCGPGPGVCRPRAGLRDARPGLRSAGADPGAGSGADRRHQPCTHTTAAPDSELLSTCKDRRPLARG
jgi:uncharacterized membrane protein YfcA